MFGMRRKPKPEPRVLPEGARRLHISFIGEVQGVGFRWTAQLKAREVGITGWVRNESDGSVTMEIQGSNDEIARFFGLFNRSYANYPIEYIMDEKEEIPLDPTETDFEVRFNHS